MWIAIANGIGSRQGVGGGVGPTPPPYTPPMDAYPADVAYSVRLVNSTYSGPCIEAYRVSDGATQDIGFDSFGRVSATELAAFSGGSVLEVQTWYDQMPGANHAVSTVNNTAGTLTRAIVYDGSSIVTDGIEPALDFVNPVDFPTLRFSNIGAASGYESFQVTNAATNNGGTPLYVTATGYNFNHHQPISYPNGNVYDGFGSNVRPAFLGIGYPNMYMQHVYNTTSGGRGKEVRINNKLVGTASAAANVGSLSHYISAMAKTQVGDTPAGRYTGYIKELFIYKAIQTSGMRDALTSNINNFYQIGNFPDYTSGFLADYPNAAAAYSVRQLSNTAIKCMRVRRAVAPFDEKDIGFTAGGDLDEAAIVAFGGSDVLLVSAWYDQSGQSRHATQITPGSQPQIYNGTAVITENGKPILSGGQLNYTSNITYTNNLHSVFNVLRFDANAIYASSYNAGITNHYGVNFRNNLLFERVGGLTNYHSLSAQPPSGAQNLVSIIDDATNVKANVNGTLSSVSSIGPYTAVTTLTHRGEYALSADVKIQEQVIYLTDQSSNRTGIETNIDDYYKIIVNDEAATSGFLFDYPNAAVAYSVRQLNNNAEFAMQVERSDGRTKNIGFDGNGDLDTQAIIDFAGASVATISQWYDQSGNQVHMAQNNPTMQPMIYDGASVITDNNKPCIEFLGASNLILQTANATPSVSQPTTYFVTANKPNHSSYLWDGISSRQAQGDQTWIFAGGLSYNFYPNSELGSQVLFTALFNGASSVGRINASQTATGNPGSNALGGIKIISKEGNKYQEFVVYGADQTSQFTPIESDIMTYYNIP